MALLAEIWWNQTSRASFDHAMNNFLITFVANLSSWIGYPEISVLACKINLLHSLMYFCFDLCRYKEKDKVNWSKILHHLVCIVAGVIALSFPENVLLFTCNAIFFHELSQPLWALTRAILDKKKFVEIGYPPAFDLMTQNNRDGVVFLWIILFVLGRFLLWPMYLLMSFPEGIDHRFAMATIGPLFLLNCYWLYKIQEGLKRESERRDAEKTNERSETKKKFQNELNLLNKKKKLDPVETRRKNILNQILAGM